MLFRDHDTRTVPNLIEFRANAGHITLTL